MEKRQWERTPRPNNTVIRWSHLYITLNPSGKLCFNRYTFERLGEPEAALLLYDRVTQTIGVEPAKLTEDDAFPICRVTKKPGRVIHAARLIKEWNIQLDHGVRFHRANFNTDGILVLDPAKPAAPNEHGAGRDKRASEPSAQHRGKAILE